MKENFWNCKYLKLFLPFLFLVGFLVLFYRSIGLERQLDCPFCSEKFQEVPRDTWVLIYPGLVGCTKQCPLALVKLKRIQESLPNTPIQIYYLVMDPKTTLESADGYLKSFVLEKPIRSLFPANEMERAFFQRLGIYLPVSKPLQVRDDHQTVFLIVPPNRKQIFLFRELEQWKSQINSLQNDGYSNSNMKERNSILQSFVTLF